MQAVILAGGKGTRLATLAKNTPKSLIEVGGKPVLEHQIELLQRYGIKDIWLLLGHLGRQIKDYFENGKKWDVNLRYLQEKTPLGTAGALKTLNNLIREDFLVFSGDVMLDFDIQRFINWHQQREKPIASLICHPNDHPFDSDLVEVDTKGRIIDLLTRPHPPERTYRNLSIASVYILSPKIFEYIPPLKKTDIEKDILPVILASAGKMYAYNTPEYLKDMGTPERLEKVVQDYLSGKIRRLNLRNKRRAVFLDRDGVINVEVDQLCRIEDLQIYKFAARAVKQLNDSEYLAIVVTNQPVIAKGLLKEADLTEIHKKLETGLGKEGAKIDAIYYCPHHPEKGSPGEIPELKIECECRKPKIGLVKQAVKDFNIDLKNSYFIGDSWRDIQCGKDVGATTVGVRTGYACKNSGIKPDYLFNNLAEAVDFITKHENN